MATKAVEVCPEHSTNARVCYYDPEAPNVHYQTASGSSDFSRTNAIQANIDARKDAKVHYAGEPKPASKTLNVTV